MSATTHWAEAEGTRLAYDVDGSGPDVTFVHAGIADRTMWDPQVDALRHRFRCIRYDIRGFGESEMSEGGFSLRRDLAAVLDAAGTQRTHLVGCSIGAGMALDFAIESSERVERLVLVGVTPAGYDADDAALDALMQAAGEAEDDGDLEKAAEYEVRAFVDGPRRPAGAAPRWLRERTRAWIVPTYGVDGWERSRRMDPPAMTRLGEVTAPTLVIVGSEDADVFIGGCKATASGIPDARLIQIEDTAHLPNLERAEAFNDALTSFLAAGPA